MWLYAIILYVVSCPEGICCSELLYLWLGENAKLTTIIRDDWDSRILPDPENNHIYCPPLGLTWQYPSLKGPVGLTGSGKEGQFFSSHLPRLLAWWLTWCPNKWSFTWEVKNCLLKGAASPHMPRSWRYLTSPPSSRDATAWDLDFSGLAPFVRSWVVDPKSGLSALLHPDPISGVRTIGASKHL